MYMRYYLDEKGNRVYTMKVSQNIFITFYASINTKTEDLL